MRTFLRATTTVGIAVALAAGCAGWKQYRPDPADLRPPLPCEGVLFVADGAGDFRATSRAFDEAIALEGMSIHIETFPWSHGYGRILADQLEVGFAREQGKRLADRILARRSECPGAPIYLVGHSAGCTVAVSAAEALPRGSLNRVLLLAPAMPADYDLRRALGSVRDEMDVFCSENDGFYIRTGVFLTEICRGHSCTPAGCTGFTTRYAKLEGGEGYCKLRHYPWNPWLAWTGHAGGHFGWYQQGYLRAFVLPLLADKLPPSDPLLGQVSRLQ